MEKIAIKIIKRKDIGKKAGVAAKAIKVLAKRNQKMVEAVNGWVFEVMENKDKEKIFSSNKILSWEQESKPVKKERV